MVLPGPGVHEELLCSFPSVFCLPFSCSIINQNIFNPQIPIPWYTTPRAPTGATFQGIVLITTEACPMETRSGFFIARRAASARKPPQQAGNGIGGRSHQNSLLGVTANGFYVANASLVRSWLVFLRA